jgi:hypothetical protein
LTVSLLPIVSRLLKLGALCGVSVFLVDCIDSRSTRKQPEPPPPDPCATTLVPVEVVVTVDLDAERATVPPYAYGMHASVYDNALHHPELPSLLHEAGISLLRYPGGGYAEMYHFSDHSLTATPDGVGYLANRSDFGSFVQVVESFGGKLMITVNYGSNLQGDGPGEPKEAAAWVAYANGAPGDERIIGVDGSGNDWQTVGYWASLRAAEPLPDDEDDGLNHLRIEHPEPLAIEYWEIGNEVFGNGYNDANMGPGFAFDLHVPYDGTPRYENELLSGTTYGAGVVAYHDEMKAVDPTIKIGAVLGTPPVDDAWARTWNDAVLAECAPVIDFAIVHWYPEPPHSVSPLPWFLGTVANTVPTMQARLRESLVEHAGDHGAAIELVMTEVGPSVKVRDTALAQGTANRSQALGLFALDTYLTLTEHGFTNVDWLELHNGTFLSEARAGAMHRKGPAFNGIALAHLLAAPGDRLVTATTDTSTLVAHAAVRSDGSVGVLVSNIQAPELSPANVTVVFSQGGAPSSGERWDYFPSPSLPASPPDGGSPDAASEVGPGACVHAGANGAVSGPTRFEASSEPLQIPPYGATLLVFDATR